MKLGLLALLSVFCLGFGCEKKAAHLNLEYRVVDKTRTFRNPRVPTELKILLLGNPPPPAEEEPHKEEKKEEKAEESHGGDGEKKDGPAPPPPPIGEYDHLPIRVYLYERTAGVLRDENIQLNFESGGGEVDLAEFVSDQKRGTFLFLPEAKFEGEAELEIFYLSNAKTRRLGEDILGSGCKSIFKVTEFIEKKAKSGGVAVNTTDQRHVSALAGTYFFVFKKPDGRRAIAYLEVQDSRYPQHMCR